MDTKVEAVQIETPLDNSLLESEQLDKVFNAFDGRLDELNWRQDEDGVLYIGDGMNPSMLARIEITENSCEAAIADADDVNLDWHKLDDVTMAGNEEVVQD